VSFLLDTGTCIAIIEDRPPGARKELVEARAAGATVAVPTVALFELWFGVARTAPKRRPANEMRLRAFLSGPVEQSYLSGPMTPRLPVQFARPCAPPGPRSAPTTC
jgi:predicted nucleic acid-binding protein